MDKFICPHCKSLIEYGTIFEDYPLFYIAYCEKCSRIYYLNSKKEIYLEGIF